jgi:hypothetical protein
MVLSTVAHTEVAQVNKWGWGEPLGTVVFVVGIALTLFLLAATIKTLASIDPEQKKRK